MTITTLKKFVAGMTAVAMIAGPIAAFAWTVPTGNAPTGNVTAPVNVGATTQIKTGVLGVTNTILGNQGFFTSGWNSFSGALNSLVFCGTTNAFCAFGVVGNYLQGLTVSDIGEVKVIGQALTVDVSQRTGGMLARNVLNLYANVAGANAFITTNVPLLTFQYYGSNGNVPANLSAGSVNIDLTHNTGSLGRNAINILSDASNTNSTLLTNTPNFNFWSTAGSAGKEATVLAGSGVFAPNAGGLAATTNLFLAATNTLFGRGLIINGTGDSTFSGNLAATANSTFSGNVAITSGSPGFAKVLTSDGNGNATWQPSSSASVSVPPPIIDYIAGPTGAGVTTSRATCNGGETLVGGGGRCDSTGIMDYNYPEAGYQSWFVSCVGNGVEHNPSAHAYAICMSTAALTSTTSSSPIWHTVTYSVGSNSQTCDAWLAANGFNVSATSGPGGGPNVRGSATGSSTGPGNGYCAYGHNTPPANGNVNGINLYPDTHSDVNWYPAANVTSSGSTYVTQIYY
jgi:hypothetical protein